MNNDIELKENLPNNDIRQADADEIEARRTMQFQLRLQGHKRAAIIEKLKDQFGAEAHIVDNDWKCRERWLPRAAELSDVNSIVASIKGTDELSLQTLRDSLLLINQSLELYRDPEGGLDLSPDSPAFSLMSMRERVIKTISDINKGYRENMNKMGILKEAPKRVEVNEHSVEHVLNWSTLLEVWNPVFEKYPDAKNMVKKEMQKRIYGNK